MSLVEYAGFDKDENRRGGSAATAYELFGLGMDTLRIAQRLRITEAEALRRLTVERSDAKRLRSPYGGGK